MKTGKRDAHKRCDGGRSREKRRGGTTSYSHNVTTSSGSQRDKCGWDPIRQRKKERKRREALLLSWYRVPIAHSSLLCACLRNRRFCNVLLFTSSLIQLFVAERKRAFRTAWCRCMYKGIHTIHGD